MEEYYRVMAEVDLNAIAHNIDEIRRIIPRDTELMAVVKADAYGHGVFGICNTLLENCVDRLAVAILDEGVQLRKQGINLPILILGYTPEVFSDKIVEYDLIQTVFTYSMARSISEVAYKLGKKAKIHIKIDTGMGRIGFLCNDQAINEIEQIYKLPHLDIEGMFTHFSKADEEDKSFTVNQINQFNAFNQRLEERGIHIPIKHAANSAAILDVGDSHFNMVRAGIILYGLYPSEFTNKDLIRLQPAMTLKTHVIFIKDVDQGTPISYGGTYLTPCKKKIATIPVGYGDGYSRLLSSKGGVLVHNEFAPIIGRICMDQFMIDVTHIKDIKVGDEVVLFGRQGDQMISFEDIASLMGTINYEVICMVGKRVPRGYLK
ncbi:alanine racemase [Vallitalea okinawensis]|uniref:alanine racemase n=1 Tax=Vallitalea okinawensis TaxID=2078660 RepID=UPI000CFBE519|nr:alanine racemase [Vallitalea okinawensis]